MKQILKCLPQDRQTVLFSATQTQRVKDFADLTFGKSNERKLVDVRVDDTMTTVEGLEQGYFVVSSEKRFLTLYSFLRSKCAKDKKIMVFFSSCNSVKFHTQLLNSLEIECHEIHGQLKQQKRTSTISSFCDADKGILLCTNVAARGLDIPRVDYVVQYDPPDEPKDYIHRVGRTARGDKGEGRALLFLLPEELQLLSSLKAANISMKEYEVLKKHGQELQPYLENIVAGNYFLKQSATEAYKSYILAYNSHSLKDIFAIHKLDLKKVAASFGFREPPKVYLGLDSSSSKHRSNKRRKADCGKSHGIGPANPFQEWWWPEIC